MRHPQGFRAGRTAPPTRTRGCVRRASRLVMPTREGLESAVVIVAGQTLAGAESLRLSTATPEELAYHLGAVKRSLRSVLQLLAPPGGKGAR